MIYYLVIYLFLVQIKATNIVKNAESGMKVWQCWSLLSLTCKYNISRYADHPDELVSDDEDDEFDEQEISDDIDEPLYEF